ncbi:EAL domain-containing protein [Bacillus sp. FJAT-42376]|uniref:putative bifunctional diguanylate cyclase/phosphodiesterase n=1 Tax=Bacillus sp. FJAT-42376 TaxID=2014076 RepID=UPI000F4D2DD8|nr:bifunctional diguanylate cyclase/phosphodiesterase [Bacillus sp. FJAT-42376]AZB42506.1 EAL domain-containing protein [Bacillus sp. FJAT-42376]
MTSSLPEYSEYSKPVQERDNSFEFLYKYHRDAILRLDCQGMILYANDSACSLFGMDRHSLEGHMCSNLMTHNEWSQTEALIKGAEESLLPNECDVLTQKGRVCAVTAFPILANKKVSGFFLNYHDMTEMRRAEEKIAHSSYYDELTKLPNDRLVMKKLEKITSEEIVRTAIIKVNIDRFKYINEMFGKKTGDAIIRQVGQELRKLVPKQYFVGRFFNDEFVVIVESLEDTEFFYSIASELARGFKKRYLSEEQEYHVKVSFGVAIYPDHGTNPDLLLKKSDLALRISKESPLGTYSEEKSQAIERRYYLQKELMHALKRNEFLLYYQPQYDTRTKHITGMEVLLRWKHPELGIVSPAEFIPIAEETGLIIEIGKWSMQEACRQLRYWQQTACPTLRLSMNLSVKQFYQPDLVPMVSSVLEENGIIPDHFELEFTESLSMHNSDTFLRTIRELKNINIHLSIDDFGTGYSSLSYLTQLPLDKIKIDRSFVQKMLSSKQDEIVIKAIIGLAENLGLQMIAEGVESQTQAAFLEAHGCHHMQGFLFSRPLPQEQITEMLGKQYIS